MTSPAEQYVAPADAHLESLAATFDEVYNAEWERVAESAEGSSASGVADRAATIAGIRAVHAALLAKLEAADRAVDEALQCFNADAHLESALAKLRAMMQIAPKIDIEPIWPHEAAALLAKIEAADKWQALMSCNRIRVLGTAGLDDDGDYAHIGLELWTTYPMAPLPDGYDIEDRRLLTKFAERAAYRNPQPAGGGE